MSRRVFNTFGASEEELDGLRQVLNDQNIEFYETFAGFWGVGTPAIWIHDSEQFEYARKVIHDFEENWSQALPAVSGSYLGQVNWKLLPGLVLLLAAVVWMCLAFFRFV
ncbi:MAG TPA: hypothetical protein DCY55_04595 [Gammaproteobacteria bacterium]|mgnify:CR=1 FL=1|nr:hypothetical protein [Pseudomonadota bacterium]HAY45544.1 hypothetical protein [Gammaproteobacteria bacterium]